MQQAGAQQCPEPQFNTIDKVGAELRTVSALRMTGPSYMVIWLGLGLTEALQYCVQSVLAKL